jgi:hypothetical protein
LSVKLGAASLRAPLSNRTTVSCAGKVRAGTCRPGAKYTSTQSVPCLACDRHAFCFSFVYRVQFSVPFIPYSALFQPRRPSLILVPFGLFLIAFFSFYFSVYSSSSNHFSICISMYLSVHLSVIYPSTCLSSYLPTYIHTRLPVFRPTLPTYMSASLPYLIYLSTHIPTYLYTNLHAFRPTLPILPTYLYNYMPASLPYLPTYVPVYLPIGPCIHFPVFLYPIFNR